MIISNVRLYTFCYRNRTFYKKVDGIELNIYQLNGIASPFLLGKSIYVDADMVKDAKMQRC